MKGIDVSSTLLGCCGYFPGGSLGDDIFRGHDHVIEDFMVATIVLIGTLAVVHVFNKSVCVYDVSTMFPETK